MSREPLRPRFRRGTWLSAARGDRSRLENSREIAFGTRLARCANKVNAQSPSIISISALLSPERGRRCPKRGVGRIIATAPPRSTPLSSLPARPSDLARARERVLRSPPSFPFPSSINNFIRRSREREAVINYRAVEKRSVPISTFCWSYRRTGKPPIFTTRRLGATIEAEEISALVAKLFGRLPLKRNTKKSIEREYRNYQKSIDICYVTRC